MHHCGGPMHRTMGHPVADSAWHGVPVGCAVTDGSTVVVRSGGDDDEHTRVPHGCDGQHKPVALNDIALLGTYSQPLGGETHRGMGHASGTGCTQHGPVPTVAGEVTDAVVLARVNRGVVDGHTICPHGSSGHPVASRSLLYCM